MILVFVVQAVVAICVWSSPFMSTETGKDGEATEDGAEGCECSVGHFVLGMRLEKCEVL